MEPQTALKRTPLYDLHLKKGAKMVPFAGYQMPVQFSAGILKEHLHTREKAGLFDVSHMGQAFLKGKGSADIGKVFEKLVPGNISGLKRGRLRYTVLLNGEGGILDDFMVTRFAGADNTLYIVVNAACKDGDFAYMSKRLAKDTDLEILESRALLALQGPKAEDVLTGLWKGAADLSFMESAIAELEGHECYISRSGYTGEDGFEISAPATGAVALTETLLDHPDVAPIGLGARDSLRLEAGLCLYGHDIDETTSPVEANLVFTVAKPRREVGDFPGAERILMELKEGPKRLRVGIRPLGRAPAREGAEIVDGDENPIGKVTSGGFAPSVGAPVAMGYVKTEFSQTGTQLGLVIRERVHEAEVTEMPFVKHRYKR